MLMESNDLTSESPPDFAPVSSEEMGFALSLFVEAANHRLPTRSERNSTHVEENAEWCASLYETLSFDVPAPQPGERRAGMEQETTLVRAFQVLCSYYVDDPQQAAICARVLAFYYMMERSGGSKLERWMEPSDPAAETVNLHPAVVDTMASVRLNGTVMLSAKLFAEQVEQVFQRNRQSEGGERPV